MKIISKAMIICTISSVSCAFAQISWFAITNSTEYPAQLTIKVLDEDNNPVGGIRVGASAFWKHLLGDNLGTEEDKTVMGLTDTNGVATLTFPCITGEVAYNTRPFTGFYGNVGSQKIRFTDVVAGKWQPWNPIKEITPIPQKTHENHQKSGLFDNSERYGTECVG
jgi:hypothetical protein